MNQYFPQSYKLSGGNVKATTGTDTSMLASKTHLASLKTEVDNLDLDKFKTMPADLSKLSNVVNDDVIKTMYDKLVIKINAIDTKITGTKG